MSIPTHFNGSLLNIMGGTASSPPPPVVTFDTVIFHWPSTGEATFNPYVTNFLFGNAGTVTAYYTSQASFTTDHPGLTSQPFTGIAPANGNAPAGSFSGFSLALLNGTPTVYDAGWFSTHFPNSPAAFPSLSGSADQVNTLTITFSPAVNSFGMNLGKGQDPSTLCSFTVKDGVTTLTTQTINGPGLSSVTAFTSFAGYSSAGG